MDLLTKEPEIKYCESCREKIQGQYEIYRIRLETPSSGMDFFKQGRIAQLFILCKHCFIHTSSMLEKHILKHRGAD